MEREKSEKKNRRRVEREREKGEEKYCHLRGTAICLRNFLLPESLKGNNNWLFTEEKVDTTR